MWDCSCSCRGVGLLSTPPPPACCGLGLGLGLGFLSLGSPAFPAPSAARLGLSSRPPLSLSCWAARSANLNSADVDDRTPPPPPVHPFRVSSGVQASDTPILSPTSLSIPFGDREVIIETGLIGRQANGAVTVSDGETIVYTTVCAATDPTEPSDFVPLTVQYQERLSAAGRTSGGFIKREGRARENEILVCRLIDRPIRPLIAKGFNYETQVLVWVLSYDGVHAPEPLAITSAGAALALSDIPFERAVAGVRVGYIDGAYLVNPTVQQLSRSKLDLVLAGTSEAVLMIEGYCEFLTEEQLLAAVEVGQQAISKICEELENFASKYGKKKNLDAISLPPTVIESYIQDLFGEKLASALQIKGKKARAAAIGVLEQKILTALAEDGLDQVANKDDERDAVWDEEEDEELVVEDGEVDEGDVHVKPVLRRPITQRFDPVDVKTVFKEVSSKVMRELIVQKGLRSDGRGVTQVRPIQSLCGLLPRAHGSALFTRGETQALAVVTLGGNDMGQRLDNLNNIEDIKRFYLQYTFPPSCVGETGRIGAPTRREIGHGTLAERALEPVLPLETEFPYTIRVESTITESNGSSSMASVCGGCLAMLDAGIPLKGPIAGVAMGLILRTRECGGDGEPVILTDILGSEDALGDMDFKVAGNEDGITAFQMDIKVEGISLKILEKALAQAKIGRQHILVEMTKSSPPPARSLSKYAPLIEMMKVDSDKLNIVIGPGGKTVKGIIEETGVDTIDIEDDGSISICGKSTESLLLAKARIAGLTMVPVVGQIYKNCVVKRVIAFGCFVELAPGREALLHISELSTRRVARVEDVANEGDRLDVKLIEINARGQLRVSRRALLPPEPAEAGGEGEKKPKQNDPRVWTRQTDQPAGPADGERKDSETSLRTDTSDQPPAVADEDGEKKTRMKSDQRPVVADGGEKKTRVKSGQPSVIANGEEEETSRIKSAQSPVVADGEGDEKRRIKSDEPAVAADREGERKTRSKSDQPPVAADGEVEKKTRSKTDQRHDGAEEEGKQSTGTRKQSTGTRKQSTGTKKSDQPRAEGVKRTRRTDASLGTETGRKASKQRELISGIGDNGDAGTVSLVETEMQLAAKLATAAASEDRFAEVEL